MTFFRTFRRFRLRSEQAHRLAWLVLLGLVLHVYDALSARAETVEPAVVDVSSFSGLTAPQRLLLGEKMDINLLEAADLVVIPGVGPRMADRIVAHRQGSGAFADISGLRAVRGVGPVLVRRISEYATVR